MLIESDLLRFQFHKVRLIDNYQYYKQKVHLFQFHKVRLIGCKEQRKKHILEDFNSIRYD